MSDVLEGTVSRLISEDIIEMYITEVGRDNVFDYLKREKIKITLGELFNISFNESEAPEGVKPLDLTDKIKCFVKSRDLNGNIIASIYKYNT